MRDSEKIKPDPSDLPFEVSILRTRFNKSVLSWSVFRDDLSIKLHSSVLLPALEILRDKCNPQYNYLSYITAEHWIERDPPVFEILYGLQAVPKPGTRLQLVVEVPDMPDVSVPSVTSVYPGANWHEREIFDLFGISFVNHPNMTRILTPETYPEHPLRRDFPHAGVALSEFQDRLIAQWNVSDERDYLGKFGDMWINRMQDFTTGHISLTRLMEETGSETKMESPGDIAYRETSNGGESGS
ncbi:MAG TPA: NADH-quinone oxidoreductase subunit C [Firmicutes bacterium]|nr:NADH-quinone oxidoreductase subunit C [Bacillota bacterium]